MELFNEGEKNSFSIVLIFMPKICLIILFSNPKELIISKGELMQPHHILAFKTLGIKKISEIEKGKISDDALRLLARASEGSEFEFKLKIANLIKDVDETRVNQELALLALKHDVSEELDRIIFHTKSMNQELKKQSCSGKKIDFILQELFREANTLSVKLDDPNSKNLALDAKLLVEEMREQIQNVE